MIYIEPELLERVNTWLTPAFDNDTQAHIKKLIATNPKELKESFYKNLEFGTGGMRGRTIGKFVTSQEQGKAKEGETLKAL